MATIHEKAKSTILVDGKQAEDVLKKLEKQANEYAAALAKAKLDNDHKAAKTAEKGLRDTRKEIVGVKRELFDLDRVMGNLSGSSIAELTKAEKKLNSELRKPTVKRNTEEYKKLTRQIKKVRAEKKKIRQEMRASIPIWQRLGTGVNKAMGIFAVVTAAIMGTVFAIARFVEQNAKLSDTLSDVEKKTGMTKKEVKELSSELKKIDTRSSRKELLGLVAIGGKLGIEGKDNLYGFAKAADQINVALTEDLGGNTEETIRQVGKLVELFKIKDEFGMEEGLLKVGSAINEVGQSSTANEGYLVNFARRLGGLASQADVSLPKVFGIGSALDQLGQTVEMSGTAVNKVIIDMFQDTEKYAEIAGLGIGEFSEILKTDANEAFLLFLEGLNGNNEGLTTMAIKMGELGVDGARSVAVLSVLAGNTKMVRQEQELANKAFAEGTSLTIEFNRKNDNLAAKLAKIRKRIRSAFVSSGAISAIEKIVSGLERWTQIKISKELEKERIEVNMLVGELTDANIKEDRRLEILEELKKIAPDIVESLTDEGKATRETTKALREYNKEMINKIILARKDEDIEKAQHKVATRLENRIKQENKIRKIVAQRLDLFQDEEKLQELNSIWLNENLNLVEKVRLMQENGLFGATVTASPLFPGQQVNEDPLEALVIAIQNEEEANGKLNELFDQRKQLFERLFDLQENPNGKKKVDDDDPDPPSGGIPKTYEEDLTALKELESFILNDLKQAYLDAAISKEELEYQSYAITLQLLEKEKAIRQKHGKDSMDLDGQILDNKIEFLESVQDIVQQLEDETMDFMDEAWEAELKAQQDYIDRYTDFLSQKAERDKDYSKKSKKRAKDENEFMLREKEKYANAAMDLGDAVASALEMSKNRELKAAGENDEKKEAIEKKYAERQRNVAAFQAGVEGLVEIARINSNAGVNADLTQTLRILLTSAAVIRTGATVGAILSQQYALGKYPVTGPLDGKSYNATYVGRPQTGFYSTPSIGLFNEDPNRPEMVVDGATTQKLIFDYPQVYNAIRSVASGGIPQFAEGKYPEQSGMNSSSSVSPELMALMAAQTEAIAHLNARLDAGIEAFLVYSKFQKVEKEISEISKKVNL